MNQPASVFWNRRVCVLFWTWRRPAVMSVSRRTICADAVRPSILRSLDAQIDLLRVDRLKLFIGDRFRGASQVGPHRAKQRDVLRFDRPLVGLNHAANRGVIGLGDAGRRLASAQAVLLQVVSVPAALRLEVAVQVEPSGWRGRRLRGWCRRRYWFRGLRSLRRRWRG